MKIEKKTGKEKLFVQMYADVLVEKKNFYA